MQIRENPKLDNYQKAVELASLIGSNSNLFLSLKNLAKYKLAYKKIERENNKKISLVLDGEEKEFSKKELSKKIKEITELYKSGEFYNSGNIDNIVNSWEETKLDFDDIDVLLNLDVNKDLGDFTKDRIKELFLDDNVRAIYKEELQKRKGNFDILVNGNTRLKEILKFDSLIKRLNAKKTEIKTSSFIQNKPISSPQKSLLIAIGKKIAEIQEKKLELLQKREIAIAYRLYILKKYSRDNEKKGFVETKSREEYINEIKEKILEGKNILLTGPTGTGKTALAIEAIKQIQGAYIEISGNLLASEIEEIGEENVKKIFNNFVEILSGNSATRPSDFIAKIKLEAGENGGTKTKTELGKVLKAFVEGKIPLIDEIDLIPDDVTFRIKHLFELRPGSEYAPQENGNEKYTLKNTKVVATANIKSEKHQDREDIDPAILRLFDNIEIKYLDKNEVYDLILAMLSEKGFISNVTKEELDSDNGVIVRLIYALKEIEESYLGYGDGESISFSGRDVESVYLQKAILETGKLVRFFRGFKGKNLSLTEHIKNEVIDFMTNGAYPKEDILILTKIFSAKGLISMQDLEHLSSKVSKVSKKEFKDNILTEKNNLDIGEVAFIDSYELANLDPFNIRNFDELDLLDNSSELKRKLRELDTKLIILDVLDEKQENKQELENVIGELLDSENIEITDEIAERIIGNLFELGMKDEIEKLGKLEEFNETYLNFKKILETFSKKVKDIKKQVVQEIDKKLKEGDFGKPNEREKELIKSWPSDFREKMKGVLEFTDKTIEFYSKRDGGKIIFDKNIKTNLKGVQRDYIMNKERGTMIKKDFLRLERILGKSNMKYLIDILGLKFEKCWTATHGKYGNHQGFTYSLRNSEFESEISSEEFGYLFSKKES